ncbi:ABC transporter ATP-binding protein [Vibrio parahaemolyticus]|nr:ABC transporter ATP-binding protein [Vibrio parahaemolyticus]EHZ2783955.1 ABC transporter ATP-binding protein [Vibrio parahaemolyticus]
MSEINLSHAFHSEPVIQIRDLCVDYITDNGDFNAVKSVSFDIGKGEVFGLAGESGCGKSTIAFSINRLHKPPAFISGGQILFQGKDILRLSDKELSALRWSEIAMVFQSAMNSLNPVLTIQEQFADVLRHHQGLSNEQAKDRAEKLLDLVNIPRDRLGEYPHQFSGGMRQRLVIAIALSLNPKLIIMDEPTSMLDVSIRLGVLNLMQRMKQELGIGFLYITHDLATAHYIAEETAVMYKGQIVEWGDTHAILKNPQHPYTKLLISAVPDPDLPFGNLVKNEPNYSIDADEIRHRNSVVVDEYDQVGPNHFVKQWIEAA